MSLLRELFQFFDVILVEVSLRRPHFAVRNLGLAQVVSGELLAESRLHSLLQHHFLEESIIFWVQLDDLVERRDHGVSHVVRVLLAAQRLTKVSARINFVLLYGLLLPVRARRSEFGDLANELIVLFQKWITVKAPSGTHLLTLDRLVRTRIVILL